ncbi:MAG: tRNA (N(6)-L-threonylcarbamoyladenosine(37)-C(2))-methylthiotransferase MtaB [Rickettsiales bacterium]|nr:tRNA (N(6)-L-threonylcarbamoyladenosine(37)-C(2))-methylthiotransferase MtaB [Rickettsiales bacterium]
MKRKPQIFTFGCRLNAYESEVIRSNLLNTPAEDMVVINTCSVTHEAERQARQAIRRARRDNPSAEIIVTGCAAQVDPASFAGMPEVDRVLGNIEKLHLASYRSAEPVLVNNIMSIRETAGHLLQGFEDRARAIVQVQQGCDHRCTFCIIPFGRGNSRSVPIGQVVTQVRQLVENGYVEIVLSGVDISSYGDDLPGQPSLGQMIRRLLAQLPELRRLRISSIDCIEIDDDLKRVIAEEERLMPHLHLSLQSGDNMILKRMKRRHSRQDAVHLCDELRSLRPDIVFGADLIAGFPTETDKMFRKSLTLIEDCGLTWLHVFPYSERSGTPAAKMPPIDKTVRKARAASLRDAGAGAVRNYLESRIGQIEAVLIEKSNFGRTAHFAPIHVSGDIMPGKIVMARVTSINKNKTLQATAIHRDTA